MNFSQYFNVQGIKKIFKVIWNKDLIKPSIKANSVLDIDPNKLFNTHNIRWVIFDMDNTLNLPNKLDFSEDYINKLNEFKSIFTKENIAIISNTAGSSDDKNYKE